MTPRSTGSAAASGTGREDGHGADSAAASGAARGAPAGQASQTPVKALGEAASKKNHKKSRP